MWHEHFQCCSHYEGRTLPWNSTVIFRKELGAVGMSDSFSLKPFLLTNKKGCHLLPLQINWIK